MTEKKKEKNKMKKDDYYVQYLINTIKVLYTVYNVSTVIQDYISTHSSMYIYYTLKCFYIWFQCRKKNKILI